MCDFLTGPNNVDRKKIAELSTIVELERQALDVIFHAFSEGNTNEAMDLYSKILLARTENNYQHITKIGQHK